MTDESRTSEPQPPSNRSIDVEVVTVIVFIFVLMAVGIGAILVALGIGAVLVDTGVVVVGADDVVLAAVVSVGLGAVGLGLAFVGLRAVSSTAFMTFIGNAVRGVSRLRLALRQPRVAAPFALAVWIGGRSRRWRAEDWLVALAESPQPIRYSLGLVVAATRMRLYDLGGLLVKAARWALASNRRTWWPLGSLLTLAAVNIHLSQGWGSAFYTLPTIIGFHLGVEWLRHRWGIELKPKPSAGDPGRDQ